MFFNTQKIRKDIDTLYASLTKKGKIPKNWWTWDKKKKKFHELSEEDENLIDDILALYENAKLVGKEDLVREIEAKALELQKQLKVIEEEIILEEAPSSATQQLQKETVERIVDKLRRIVSRIEIAKQAEEKETRKELAEFVAENTHQHKFTFYRAEHISAKPRLNEDSSGQFGKGVYFTAEVDVAKRFRSKRSRIFNFYIRPKTFLKVLKPLFISAEEIKPFENRDPAVFQEFLREEGYGETSFCVIGPIPEFGYTIQIMIDKDALDRLIEEGLLRWEVGEEFN